ncbi:16S rRNA (cytosine967-C5)-methyltransferase [Arthrobacter stackebrandtii]|uniref:16S rRNA (Cytosine967-C5)-methyltransferase n=1 Tax=Arthrobacter stackebrandtii TaxID=272161 RepID=A0ABS4Z1F6_9MICC|nr:transcription antitermination factor NusB [Arthrobacter stackebrandtii]MBP2414873.1 16S rRNA (cytosine967-C5)-methyltransferase [Arthrobacter stackebrandtii]PYG98776.1 methyltransferase [Arthrobacter stackebrandtii]
MTSEQGGRSGHQNSARQNSGGGQRGGGVRRRDDAGRERNRSTGRNRTETAPGQRTRVADPARLVAFEVLRAVSADDAYANLVLPTRIRKHGLDRRDAGFATELTYGALRAQGTYDAILAKCVDRPLSELDPAILDALRIGAHQLMAMRVPTHAALDQTVGLARAVIGAGPSGLVNAVLRKVAAKELPQWLAELTDGLGDDVKIASIVHAHPEWIVRAMRQALVAHGRDVSEIEALLEADNAAPVVNLVALPGLGSLDEAFDAGFTPGELVIDSALSSGGDVGRLDSVRDGSVRVQDAGSQLVARALAAVMVSTEKTDGEERWLDMCAGPGGKAALLAALAAEQDAWMLANEPAPHRAKLVSQALAAVPADSWTVRTGDGRDIGREHPEAFDRILVDAPCTGLGALRRRPESRWRRKLSDVAELGPLQRELLESALAAVKPGGVVAYVTCSPHVAETIAVVEDAMRKRTDLELLDAGAALDAVSLSGSIGAGNTTSAVPAHRMMAQLWPHIHQSDAMFMALIRKN